MTGNPLASTYYVMAANVVMLAAVLAVRQTDFEPKQWPPPASTFRRSLPAFATSIA